MRFLKNETYCRDIQTAIEHTVRFDTFSHKRVLVLGATGLIGSFLTDCFLYANENKGTGIIVYAASRNINQLKSRFGNHYEKYLNLLETDVTNMNIGTLFDYVIHAAGYGHPKAFRETPVEVFLSNVMGTQSVLELAKLNKNCRVLYVSSGEVQEYVDHLSVRACYPMGKRAAETLCISYHEEYGVDVVIARPCHTFGANVTGNDNRAASQFLTAAAEGTDIEMYSAGEQVRSFSYVADCVSGLLSVLAGGESGMVYGISSGESCSVREFANRCAFAGNCRVKVHTPTGAERSEASPIREQVVKNDALRNLGWCSAFSVDEGIRNSVQIMKEMSGI